MGRWSDVAAEIRQGLKGLRAPHRQLISRRRAYVCSLNLDAARRAAEPTAARWDYVLGGKDGGSTGVEVHPAKASEVDRVIAKKTWAQQGLISYCGLRVTDWYWLRPPRSSLQFTVVSPKARLLAKNGIHFPVARLP
jgi:hypothetical protein